MDKEKNNENDIEQGTSDNHWNVSVSTSYTDEPGNDKVNGTDPENNDTPAIPVVETETKFPVWVNILAIIGVLIGAMFVGALVDVIVSGSGEDKVQNGLGSFLSYVVTFGITIVFAWWITTRKGTVTKPFSFSLKKTNPTLILWGFILVMITSVVLEPLLDLFPREYLDLLQKSVGSGGWTMLTVIVAAPILEELLFRGIIQQELSNGFGSVKGVLMAAAVFGVIHIIPQQAINAFFIGIILGYIYIKSGSLVPVIVIHAINNAIAYTFMQVFDDNLALTKDLFINLTWYWILYGLCCVVFVFAGWKLIGEIRKLDNRPKMPMRR